MPELRRRLETPLLHPDADAMRGQSGQVLDWLVRHFATLAEQPIGLTGTRAELEAMIDEPPPETGTPFESVFHAFQERIAPYAFRVNHPRFLAFVPGTPTFLSVLGDILCSGTNFFAGVWLEAAGPAQVELTVLNWFRQLLGFPASTRGILTTGGSEANLTALLVARERLTYEDRGRAVLYITSQRHLSVDRAAKTIGLRRDQVRPIRSDQLYRVDLDGLVGRIRDDRQAGLLPWAVVANAGATNTGAVDPLHDLGVLCNDERLWLHVDAAYGWPAVLTREGKRDLHGIEQADSVTLDPHKWFGQTFEAGCVLIRDGARLTETFAMRPDYMQDVAPEGDEVNFSDHGLALTRRFRALKIWLSVKVLGIQWYRDLVERCFRLAEFAQVLLMEQGCFEILCPRQLSIVCFRYRPERPTDEESLNRLNLALVDELCQTGRAFLSSTLLHGRVALRFCFVNWRTMVEDVEEIVGLLKELGGKIA